MLLSKTEKNLHDVLFLSPMAHNSWHNLIYHTIQIFHLQFQCCVRCFTLRVGVTFFLYARKEFWANIVLTSDIWFKRILKIKCKFIPKTFFKINLKSIQPSVQWASRGNIFKHKLPWFDRKPLMRLSGFICVTAINSINVN